MIVATTAIVVTLAAALVLSLLVCQILIDRTVSKYGISVIACTLSLTLALSSLLLLPLNLLTLRHPLAIIDAATLYHWVYAVIVVWVVVVLPFTYFYSEALIEGSLRTSDRLLSAFQSTAIFAAVVVALLLASSLLYHSHDSDSTMKWTEKVRLIFRDFDSLLFMDLAILILIGHFYSILYTANGLATLPLTMIGKLRYSAASSEGETLPLMASTTSRAPMTGGRVPSTTDNELRARLALVLSNMAAIHHRYGNGRQSHYTSDDQQQLQSLDNEKRQLERVLAARASRQSYTGRTSYNQSSTAVTVIDNVTDLCMSVGVWLWNALAPVRWLLGILALCLSLLLLLSLTLATISRLLYSSCGIQCAYRVSDSENRLPNPLDQLLQWLAGRFPLNTLAFAIIALYSWLATLSSLINAGIRLLVWRVFDIKPRRTWPHVLVLSCAILTLATLALQAQLTHWLPQYTQQSVVARMMASINTRWPAFAVVFFYSDIAFIAVFVASLAMSVVRARRRALSGYEVVDEETDSWG